MLIFSRCLDCQHFKGKDEEERFICEAFPNGIPEDVFWNKIDHTENTEGDNGIKYQEREGFRKE